MTWAFHITATGAIVVLAILLAMWSLDACVAFLPGI